MKLYGVRVEVIRKRLWCSDKHITDEFTKHTLNDYECGKKSLPENVWICDKNIIYAPFTLVGYAARYAIQYGTTYGECRIQVHIKVILKSTCRVISSSVCTGVIRGNGCDCSPPPSPPTADRYDKQMLWYMDGLHRI